MDITKTSVQITDEKRAKFLDSDKIKVLKLASPNVKEPYYIYAIVNITNKRTYVGKCRNIYDRANNYIWCYDNRANSKYVRRPIMNAICEYGIDSFRMIPICIVDGQEAAGYAEQYYIQKFNTTDPLKGYNISTAIDIRYPRIGDTGFSGHNHSVSTKVKKSYPVACINPEEKVFIISQGMKLFADLVGTGKDLIKNSAHRPCRFHGYFIIFLNERQQNEFRDIAIDKLAKAGSYVTKNNYTTYLELVDLVKKFTATLDTSLLFEYKSMFLAYNPEPKRGDPTYIVHDIGEYIKYVTEDIGI